MMKRKKLGRGIEDFIGAFVSPAPTAPRTSPRREDENGGTTVAGIEAAAGIHARQKLVTPEAGRTRHPDLPVSVDSKVVPVVSVLAAERGEDASMVVAALAAASTTKGMRVATLDASLEVPSVGARLDVEHSPSVHAMCLGEEDCFSQDDIPCYRLDVTLPSVNRIFDGKWSGSGAWVDEVETGLDLLWVNCSWDAAINARLLLSLSDVIVVLVRDDGDPVTEYAALKTVRGLNQSACLGIVGEPATGRQSAPDNRHRLIRVARKYLQASVLDLGSLPSGIPEAIPLDLSALLTEERMVLESQAQDVASVAARCLTPRPSLLRRALSKA